MVRRPEEKRRAYSAEEIKRYISDIRMDITENADTINDETAMEMIEEYVFSLEKSGIRTHMQNKALIERLFLSLRREMDILQPYVDDRSVSEIMVNGKDHVFIERNGAIERADICFDSVEDLEELIRRIASKVHREINELNPIVDARLSDGSRVNAVYKNVALNGPILTIRKFPERAMTMDDLMEKGTLDRQLAEFLKKLVAAGYNCFICGGTSSGKTTLLNVLSQSVPSGERVVVIEDSAELQIGHIENIVRMECRNANVQGKGEVTMTHLIKASLRMRPDRIIVGRGKRKRGHGYDTGHEYGP